MINPHDDYPYHQIGATFDEAGTSDVRFFDRFWFSVHDPAGRFGLIAGLGVYKNMDVLDGFVSIASHGRQSNVRVSRPLRPDWTMHAGPLRVEIIEPMRRHRLVLDGNDQGVLCDLTLRASGEPFGEAKYVTRDRGWLEKDYVRLFQLARATGWVEVDGQRFDSGPEGWPAGRDRSFGVRPGMGGPGPNRGGKDLGSGLGAREAFYVGTLFETANHYGTWALSEDSDGILHFLSGAIYDREGHRAEIAGASHDLRFAPGSLAGEGGRYRLTDRQERPWTIETVVRHRFVYQGFGYVNGWSDKLGLGAWRGASALETDRYDLSDPAHIVDESGRHVFGQHGMLHTQFTMTLDGEPGHGEGIVFLMPQHRRYGQAAAKES